MPKVGWGDADDSDEEDNQQELVDTGASSGKAQSQGSVTVPPTHYSRVDQQGIQIVTSYKPGRTAGQLLIKTVTKQRVERYIVKEQKGVLERRVWKKFGVAADDEKEGNQSTVQAKDDIILENPNADTDLQDEDPASAIAGNLNAFWAKQQRRQLERKYDVTGETGEEKPGGEEAAADGWTQVRAGTSGAGSGLGGAGAAGSRYVPPSMRGGAAGAAAAVGNAYKPPGRGGPGTGSSMDDLNTIRVTNLSENTTEADLQELFSHFGRVSRVYLAKNKETLESRGFAFVTFVNQKDAAAAMEKLQGFGYDHLILKLEWARPNTPKDPATAGNEFRSGYGKALAQDTKEKVSFASNLTKN